MGEGAGGVRALLSDAQFFYPVQQNSSIHADFHLFDYRAGRMVNGSALTPAPPRPLPEGEGS